MKHCTAIRHVLFEDLGSLESILPSCGYDFSYIDTPILNSHQLNSFNPTKPDLLIVLGGPASANDTLDYPFFEHEMLWIKTRIDKGLPVLGICLGAQLMAKAMDSKVYRARGKEIGWSNLDVDASAAASELAVFSTAGDGSGAQVLHWHGETFDLPNGAEHLASTALCDNQAFAIGNYALGLQFHVEAAWPKLENWLIGHNMELNSLPGMEIPAFRSECRAKAALLEQAADSYFSRWLAGLEQK